MQKYAMQSSEFVFMVGGKMTPLRKGEEIDLTDEQAKALGKKVLAIAAPKEVKAKAEPKKQASKEVKTDPKKS